MCKIEELENRNRFLNNEIAILNAKDCNDEEKKLITGYLKEIEINKEEILRLKAKTK